MQLCILMAMQAEADPLIEQLQLEKDRTTLRADLPFKLYRGQSGEVHISLMTSGKDHRWGVDNVSTVPATLMAYLAIDKLAPTLLLNCGTAGGRFAKGARLGDVYLSGDEFCFHDRRIFLPGFDRYGVGHLPSADTTDLGKKLGLKRAIISTGNSLDLTAEDERQIHASGAVIKDMEAAAIAWICYLLKTPMMALKAVTDLIDKDDATEAEFVKNLAFAATRLTTSTVMLIEQLARKNAD